MRYRVTVWLSLIARLLVTQETSNIEGLLDSSLTGRRIVWPRDERAQCSNDTKCSGMQRHKSNIKLSIINTYTRMTAYDEGDGISK